MNGKIRTDVAIVGAGPTGLALACQLIRYGVDFVIFDAKESITDLSKAIAVQARTLEIYQQLELADKAIAEGAIAKRVHIITNGAIRGSLDLSDIGKNLSPFPFALLLEQSKNEQLLGDYLARHGKNILWQTALESISQDNENAVAITKNANGERGEITAKYLVGCDGAKSAVRHKLNFTFEGNTIDALFYVADVEMAFSESHDAVYVTFGADSFVAFFPMRGENSWRIVGNLPEDAEREEGRIDEESRINYDEIENKIRHEVRMSLDITGVKWFSVYRVHSRRVDKFSDGRCFLAGDAAHIHTPAGGQGMNTGIGDAYNLAWKLAFVLKGNAEKSLLDTYNVERLENAKRLLETTDRLFELGTHDDFLTSFIRTHVFPLAAQYALRLDLVKQTVFPVVSQIGINYRHSPMSDHTGDEDFKIKAGDRMPYFTIDSASIYDFLRAPKFHFLIFSDEQSDFQNLKTEVETTWRDLFDCRILPLSAPIREIFGVSGSFALLLRPDNHIGFISEEISMNVIRDYEGKTPIHSFMK